MISHSIRAATLATVFAAVMSSAAPSAQAASFDGPWSVVVMTRSGACDQTYRYGMTIARGVVYYAGGGPVSLTGRVLPSGAVTVRVSSGPQYAVGSGHLFAAAGAEAGAGKVRAGPAPACGARREVERAGRSTPTNQRTARRSEFGDDLCISCANARALSPG